MSNHSEDVIFSRMLLKAVRPAVNKLVPPAIRKEAWTYGFGRDHWEFQIPTQDFYWHGNASCAYEARYNGWMAYLEQRHAAEYEAFEAENSEA